MELVDWSRRLACLIGSGRIVEIFRCIHTGAVEEDVMLLDGTNSRASYFIKWHLALTEERSESGNAHTHPFAPPGGGKSPAAGKGEENTGGKVSRKHTHKWL